MPLLEELCSACGDCLELAVIEHSHGCNLSESTILEVPHH